MAFRGTAKLPLVVIDEGKTYEAGTIEMPVTVSQIQLDKDGRVVAVLDVEAMNGDANKA